MGDQSQEDIDALLGSMEESSETQQADNTDENSAAAAWEASLAEDTGETESNQEKDTEIASESASSESPKGEPIPWVDFIPEDDRKKPTNLIEHLQRAAEDSEFALVEDEMLQLAYVAQDGINEAYYHDWIRSANSRIRQTVALRRRLAILKAKQESSGDQVSEGSESNISTDGDAETSNHESIDATSDSEVTAEDNLTSSDENENPASESKTEEAS